MEGEVELQPTAYLWIFCRAAVSSAFAYAAVSKLLDFSSFQQTIGNFRIVQSGLVKPVSYLFLIGEMLAAVLLVVGGKLLLFGYGLAAGLLLLFSAALYSALIRNIETACNCFGANDERITAFDIWRNVLLVSLALIGLFLSADNQSSIGGWSFFEVVSTSMFAVAFVFIWVNLRTFTRLIAELF